MKWKKKEKERERAKKKKKERKKEKKKEIKIEKELDNLGRTKKAMMMYEDAMPENYYPDFAVVNDDGCMMTAWDLERKSNFIDSGSQHLPMSKPEDRF